MSPSTQAVSSRQRPAPWGQHEEVSRKAAFVPGWVPAASLVAHSLMSLNKTCNLQACFAGEKKCHHTGAIVLSGDLPHLPLEPRGVLRGSESHPLWG